MANNKSEAKIKISADINGFKSGMAQANSELKGLRAELRLNETQTQATGKTVETLNKTHEILENQLSVTENKAKLLTEEIERQSAKADVDTAKIQQLKTQLTNVHIEEERLKQKIQACNDEIKEQAAAAKKTESATEKLTDKIDKQQSELDKLKKDYVDTVLQYGETSDEAKALAKQIEKLSRELADSKNEFNDAERSANKFDKSLDDVGDAARDSGGGFTIAKGAIADFVSSAVQWGIGKVGEFIDYLKELPEATREIRQDFATLETSFERQGFTVEQSTETWRDLYAIFGEDDRAVETANHIAKIADNQEELNTWVEITKGVWGSYQDSLPVEGLAEASNETAKTGKVTGVLADALNWGAAEGEKFGLKLKKNIDFTELSSKEIAELTDAEKKEYEAKKKQYEETEEWNKTLSEATAAEDVFNLALSECTSEEERQSLITETLTKLYGDAATEYEKASGAQTDAKEASADNILVQNELADTLEPMTTAWQELKNTMLEGFLPVAEKVSAWGTSAIEWMKEHPVVTKVLVGVLATLAAGLAAVAIAVSVWTVAQWALNAALWASGIPEIILLITLAIAAIVAIAVVIYEYWDNIKQAFINAWESIKSAWNACIAFFKGIWDGIVKGARNCWNAIVNAFKAAKQGVQNAWSSIKQFFANVWNGVKNVYSNVTSWFREKFNSAKQAVQNAWSSVKNFFSNIWNGIKNVFSNIGGWFRNKFNSAKQGVQNAWSSVTGFFTNIKNKIVNAFSNIKEKLCAPFQKARDTIKGIADKIKGFFKGEIKMPKIKKPKFSITPAGWKVGDLLKGVIPKLNITWHAKAMDNPMILDRPTIFGHSGGSLLGGGEAGREMIGGVDTVSRMIQNAVDRSMRSSDIASLARSIEDLANRPIELNINGRQFALATAGDTDSVNGQRSVFRSRGLEL